MVGRVGSGCPKPTSSSQLPLVLSRLRTDFHSPKTHPDVSVICTDPPGSRRTTGQLGNISVVLQPVQTPSALTILCSQWGP